MRVRSLKPLGHARTPEPDASQDGRCQRETHRHTPTRGMTRGSSADVRRDPDADALGNSRNLWRPVCMPSMQTHRLLVRVQTSGSLGQGQERRRDGIATSAIQHAIQHFCALGHQNYTRYTRTELLALSPLVWPVSLAAANRGRRSCAIHTLLKRPERGQAAQAVRGPPASRRRAPRRA